MFLVYDRVMCFWGEVVAGFPAWGLRRMQFSVLRKRRGGGSDCQSSVDHRDP